MGVDRPAPSQPRLISGLFFSVYGGVHATPFIRNLKEGLNIFLSTLTAINLEKRQWEKCSQSPVVLTPGRGLMILKIDEEKAGWSGVGSYMCKGVAGTARGQ